MKRRFQQVNATPYGLAAGIFTNDLQRAFYAAYHLDFGGIHINETSSGRVDLNESLSQIEDSYGKR